MTEFVPGFEGAVGIFGGSFNPVHTGHVRMAVEIREALRLCRIDLTPAHTPPHKSVQGLLPYPLRLELTGLAVQEIPFLEVSAVEGEVRGPSYSYDTMARLLVSSDRPVVFLVGSPDFLAFPDWHRGLELPLLTDIVVAERQGVDNGQVLRFLERNWACRQESPGVYAIDGGRRVAFVRIPRLDISASLVRKKFLARKELCGLVPASVQRHMHDNAGLFRKIWGARTV